MGCVMFLMMIEADCVFFFVYNMDTKVAWTQFNMDTNQPLWLIEIMELEIKSICQHYLFAQIKVNIIWLEMGLFI